ncbi:NAD+ diphosphatase [Poseidonocella pacifica]|uniref:NAD(+) diphosphatase n=1 Tax=Poseidonocella pacifica TaxID=871651 RepID=A0A1I0XIS1_9RHOB|nr:NAD(+) diphosphatase [Poseidonocella pacifica]SFB00902.1 NAD+ diphosphatase [Poseidonocella pacifica]
MRRELEVTLGGSGLDRAVDWRGNVDEITNADTTNVILFWRGEVLIDAEGNLVRLAPNDGFLSHAGPPVLLARTEEGAAILARALPAAEDVIAPDGTRFADIRQVMAQLSRQDGELAAMARGLLEWHQAHRFCARCGSPSDMIEGGWQRQCPACGARHFPRTDPVVIVLATSGQEVLLGRAPGWPEGMFSLLAGYVEPGETIEAAARREVFEEVGVELGPVSYLASQPWPFPASLMLGCRAEARSREFTLDPVEIEAARWVGRAELLDAFAGRHAELLPARPGSIAHILMREWLADRLD